jgi:hypothetical protein
LISRAKCSVGWIALVSSSGVDEGQGSGGRNTCWNLDAIRSLAGFDKIWPSSIESPPGASWVLSIPSSTSVSIMRSRLVGDVHFYVFGRVVLSKVKLIYLEEI